MIPFAIAILSWQPTPTILDYVQTNLKDATFTAKRIKGDQRELKKINDDFGQSYRFESIAIRAKDPFMLRLEASVEDTSIVYIMNGTMMAARIPRARINTKQNLAKSPGRRQSWLDFGILTPSLFNGFYRADFVRKDRASGDIVFDLTFADKALDDTSRQRIWVDPDRKIVTKREWYNQPGRQLATFYYEVPAKVDGVWMPTQLTVKNIDDKVAGISRYSSIKINSGLPDSMFDVG